MATPQQYFAYLTDKLGYTPIQAAALLGNIQQESGFNPSNYNTGEGAYGLVQWRGDRLGGLQQFAKAQGTSPSDWQTQLDYIKREMEGPEAGNASGFLSAKTLPDANAALKNYIRYGDNSQDTRLGYAGAFLPSSYANLNAPPLVSGSQAPPLPPPIDIDSPSSGTPGGTPGGVLGVAGSQQPQQQQAQQQMGSGLLGQLVAQMNKDNAAPLAQPNLQALIPPSVRKPVDMSQLAAFLQQQQQPSNWASSLRWPIG